ncbi:GNAT family N-acetyltransferase [Eggerthella guodeyinii]|nr:GNAT family N-acetyltransferase [Eggerthella guodeyinii]
MTNILETQRLLLRPLVLADAETAFRGWTGDPEVSKYVSWLPHRSIDDAIEWAQEVTWKHDAAGNVLKSDTFIWGFVLKDTHELFGSGGLIWEDEWNLYQVGYNIMKSHWGCGYTTEAMREILRYAAADLGITRVAASHAKENIASAKVLEKLGFAYEGDGVSFHIDGARSFQSRRYSLKLDSPAD